MASRTMKKLCFLLVYLSLIICSPGNRPIFGPIIAKGQSLIPTSTVLVFPPRNPVQTILSGTVGHRMWAYIVPFAVHNSATIEALITCESSGVNISRPDSNGLISWGVLQYNGTSTWADFSRVSGLSGSPINPPDAIRLRDWAIDHGFLGRWTCAKILHLVAIK
jgi:hypothetical protein